MSSDPYEQRKRLTFEQAEGVEPMPQQLKLKEISQQLRAELWALFHASLRNARDDSSWESPAVIGHPWDSILNFKHVYRDHKMADEFDPDYAQQCAKLKKLFAEGDYIAIYGFLDWYLGLKFLPVKPGSIHEVLEDCRSPYRVVDDVIIVPISSEVEREAIERAFKELGSSEFAGARTHLRKAVEALNAGHDADSIRESIHAVESVARSLTGKSSLTDALREIEKSHALHSALRKGFLSLYGFTSDEKGIRHPLLEEGSAQVDETDALFMIGACASFVSYLINRTH